MNNYLDAVFTNDTAFYYSEDTFDTVIGHDTNTEWQGFIAYVRSDSYIPNDPDTMINTSWGYFIHYGVSVID